MRLCDGAPVLHKVVGLMSFNGPAAAVGVSDGSQKSGSFAFRASA